MMRQFALLFLIPFVALTIVVELSQAVLSEEEALMQQTNQASDASAATSFASFSDHSSVEDLHHHDDEDGISSPSQALSQHELPQPATRPLTRRNPNPNSKPQTPLSALPEPGLSVDSVPLKSGEGGARDTSGFYVSDRGVVAEGVTPFLNALNIDYSPSQSHGATPQLPPARQIHKPLESRHFLTPVALNQDPLNAPAERAPLIDSVPLPSFVGDEGGLQSSAAASSSTASSIQQQQHFKLLVHDIEDVAMLMKPFWQQPAADQSFHGLSTRPLLPEQQQQQQQEHPQWQPMVQQEQSKQPTTLGSQQSDGFDEAKLLRIKKKRDEAKKRERDASGDMSASSKGMAHRLGLEPAGAAARFSTRRVKLPQSQKS